MLFLHKNWLGQVIDMGELLCRNIQLLTAQVSTPTPVANPGTVKCSIH